MILHKLLQNVFSSNVVILVYCDCVTQTFNVLFVKRTFTIKSLVKDKRISIWQSLRPAMTEQVRMLHIASLPLSLSLSLSALLTYMSQH